MSIRIAALKPIVSEAVLERDLGRLLRSTVSEVELRSVERLGDALRRAYAEERARQEPTLTPAIRETVAGILLRSAPMGAAVIPMGSILPDTGGVISVETLVAQLASWLRSEGLKVSVVRSPGPGSFRVSSIAVSWTPEPESKEFHSVA